MIVGLRRVGIRSTRTEGFPIGLNRKFSSWWWNEQNDAKKLKKKVEEKGEKPDSDLENASSSNTTTSSNSSIAPVLELQGAPRQPSVLALPLSRRPLFPGLLHPIQITDRKVYEALVKTRASGNPYIGLFLRKDDGNSKAEIGEHAVSDSIANLNEIHQMGTFAQILQMEPIQGLISLDEHSSKQNGEDGDELSVDENMESQLTSIQHREDKNRLRKALFNNDHESASGIASNAIASQVVDDGNKDESWTLVVKAHRRIQIEDVLEPGPPPLVKVQHITEFPLHTYDMDTIRAYTNEVLATMRDVIRHNPLLREHMQFFSTRFDMSDPHHVCNFAAALISAEGEELQQVLEALNLEQRLKKILTLLKKEVQLNKLQEQISKQVEDTISTNQRKYFLNEQLKQIKKELGLEHDDKDALLQKYQEKLDQLMGIIKEQDDDDDDDITNDENKNDDNDETKKKKKKKIIQGTLPADAKKVIEDEMKKLSTLEKTSPEFNVTRTYLDWLLSLPWGKYSEENLNVKKAKEILETDHYGLSDIKERILEFIAVGNLRGTVQGKIILLVGPPGVGKTSIGKSIARSLDREFYRFSVGGLSDVSEIKGHRRTYIGAMPGKAIQCLKTTGVSNPVILIDEIDKLGSGYRGDPASALLELLDPAQNTSFVDHYIDVPVDLSKVLFVCTANSTDTIPGPLLDRMEVLRLSGYDLPEKVAIAKNYLEPRAKEESGLKETESIPIPETLGLEEEAIASLARWYCREAGVRNLEQHIERIYRKVALELLTLEEDKKNDDKWNIDESKLEHYVGKPKYESDKLFDSIPPPGVVMGLAWSTTGGSALYIETTCIKKSKNNNNNVGMDDAEKGKTTFPTPGGGFTIHTTGQLGDVMKESTSLALTNAKHKLQAIDSGNPFFESNQIHAHFPSGAISKDGPSAGVTITTALLSLALNKSVKADLAMTGEISLTGMVLPVGGIKEKVIAARRSGVTTIILPHANLKDVDELPDYLKQGLSINFAKTYDDVFDIAFN